jgi:hypothetical protein
LTVPCWLMVFSFIVGTPRVDGPRAAEARRRKKGAAKRPKTVQMRL